ncbi:DUF5305 domain-containing protein [Methanococcoides sp.]|uniref:DUF5305 domain-containing protein n=1 Tax=Methanococcoides sp. TaxID=1966350 RepID=UPI00272E9BCA|nr:DUF5305 domain-containing protein [Methanococcoides sp.]
MEYRENNQYHYERVIASSYTHSANYDFIAPVTLSNPIYARGKILDSGQPAYFFSVSPTMDVFFTYAIDSMGSVQIDADCDTFVVATTTGNVGGKDKVFWQKKYPVTTGPLEAGNKGEFSYNFSLNVPEIQSKIKDVQSEIGYSQGAKVEVVTYVSYNGNVNGKNVEGVEEFSMPLIISSSFYQIPQDLDFSNTVDNYETLKVKNVPSISVLVFPILSFFSSMVLILLFGLIRKQEEVPLSHIRQLEVESEHAKFKDFISKGSLPVEVGSLIEVGLSSLQDLVDAAVDMDARVIHDPLKDVYFMIHGGIIYRFNTGADMQDTGCT